MTNQKTPTMKFKSTYNQPAQAQSTQPQEKRQFGYCKIPKYKFKDGDNLLRFLPQPADSIFGNWVNFEELGFWSQQYKGSLAMLPDTSVSSMRTKAFFELREAVPEQMKSQANPGGTISLNPSYKVGFQAVNHATGELVAVVLPGTNPVPRKDGTKRNTGAGTKVCELCTINDIKGNPKYGDIFDIGSGSLINIRVTNAGTLSASYEVIHECAMGVEDKILDEIKPFQEVFKFAEVSDLQSALSQYLGEQYSLIRGIFPAAVPAIDKEDNMPF